jgi:malate dehydrogenase (oxaloacetate-decarboxylating)
MASSYALAEYSATFNKSASDLLPDLNDIRNVSKFIATFVYKQAIDDGLVPEVSDEVIEAAINENFWEPNYRPYMRTAI